MSQLNDEQQRELVEELVAAIKTLAPDWTNHSDSDPGLTLLELFAWLSDTFDFQLERDTDRKTDLLRNLVARLSAISPGACTTSGLTRPRYFNGQLLTAADFQAEQDYSRKMMWRHNCCLFGTGIVTGLGVTVDSSSCAKGDLVIVVAPGCAIDPHGQQLSLCEPLRCVLWARGTSGYVVIKYIERATNPIPTLTGPAECSRIEEGVAVTFEEETHRQGLAIARLKRNAGRWTLDRRFRPAKIGRRPR